MTKPIKVDPLLGHAFTKAIFEGDLDALMVHLSKYLRDNELAIPASTIDRTKAEGLIESD